MIGIILNKIKCLLWNNEQSPSEVCNSWGIKFAAYCWFKCNLFDEKGLEKELYHWEDWGICRQGGAENSYHCQGWDICLPKSMKNDHTCSNFRDVNCPICLENFFTVRDGGWRLKCGHVIHSEWFDQYFKTNINCPICK